MRELISACITIIIVLVIWLNPGILHGVTKSVTGPVQAWIKNPDSVADKMPWQINPDDVKKAAGKKTSAEGDLGERATTKDAGEQSSADPGSKSATTRDPGETDPGYQSEAKADGSSKEKTGKTARSTDTKEYTDDSLGARAVAVQRARDL
jgi:hypothetical protein